MVRQCLQPAALAAIFLLSAYGDTHAFCDPSVSRSAFQLFRIRDDDSVSLSSGAYCTGDGRGTQRKRRRRLTNVSSLFASRNDACDEEDTISFENFPAGRPYKHYFATCVPGLQGVLANELVELGASNVEPSGNSGVSFTNSPDDEYNIGLKALLWLRTAHRLMELITTTQPGQYDGDEQYYVHNSSELYDFLRGTINVQSLLGNGCGGLMSLSVNTIANGHLPRELCHTHYTALSVKNALVDAVRELRDDGTRPDVNLHDADVPLVAVLRGYDGKKADVSLYRCLHSGGSLHRRGYRSFVGSSNEEEELGGGRGVVHKAALKESLAAGLLLEAGWDKLCAAAKSDGLPALLIDPMCGSATLPIEGTLIAADIAPGLMRIRSSSKHGDFNPHRMPPAIRWKDGNLDEWKALLVEAKSRAKAGLAWVKGDSQTYPGRMNCEVFANEFNPRAADLARACIANAGLSESIVLNEGDCIDWDLGGEADNDAGNFDECVPVEGRTIVVANPPWGKRLTEDIEESWESLQVFLRRECNGIESWILSGNKSLTRILRMKKSRSLVIRTGDEDLRWIQYHIFKKKSADATCGCKGERLRDIHRKETATRNTIRTATKTKAEFPHETGAQHVKKGADPWD